MVKSFGGIMAMLVVRNRRDAGLRRPGTGVAPHPRLVRAICRGLQLTES